MAENVIIRHQKFIIMQQMEELKNRHKQQPSKLNPGSSSSETDSPAERRHDRFEDGGNSNFTAVQMDNNKHNPTGLQNFDEIPIRVANSNFTKFLENNIIPHEAQQVKTCENGGKPFRFLKRGEGMARFRMGPQKMTKYANKNKQTLKLSNSTKQSDEDNIKHSEKAQNPLPEKDFKKRDEIPTLDPPDLKLGFKNWKSVFSSGKAEETIANVIDNNQLELFQPNSSIDSSTASIMEKLLDVGQKHLKEREELRVFETMEQHVLESSFCSTSSDIARLMENAVISTPVKKLFPNRNSLGTRTRPTHEPPLATVPPDDHKKEGAIENNTEQKRPEAPICTNPDKSSDMTHKSQGVANTEDLEQSLHVRFAEQVDYKSFIEYSQSLNNSSQREADGGKEFEDSEEWKEDSGEKSSSCCTSYSSSDEDVRAISPPVKLPSVVPHQRVNEHSKYDNNSQNHIRRSPVERLEVEDLKVNGMQDREQTVSSNNTVDMFPPVLSAKLKELEDQIENFRFGNNKLKALRENLEKEQKQFQQEKKKFLKEMEEEKKTNTAKLEEEKQKLAKEKFIFEKYSKSLTKNPTKEKSKEIEGLREQLREMKEELNKKESRWGAAQARVRTQVKLIEEENRKLREEVEILRKQSKHLEFLTQRKKGKPYNNTKLIHAINDHISNIAVEDDSVLQSSSRVGYFNPTSSTVKTVIIDDVDPKSLNNIKVIKGDYCRYTETVAHDGTNQSLEELSHKVVSSEQPVRESSNSPLPDQVPSIVSGQEANYRNRNNEPQEGDLLNSKKGDKSKPAFAEELSPKSVRETINEDGNVEKVYSDGRKEIRYKNGNVKKIDPLTGNEKTIYFNGDVKEIIKNGTVKYYFSESRIWQTTLPDGLEVLDFPNGQVEKRHKSGMVEIIYPNDCKKLSYPDGSQEIFFADGKTLKIEANRRQVLSLPNGQKEIRTDECLQREYPDGTVKTVYPDGMTQTVYSNGRVRLKDKLGNLVMDSGTASNSRL